MGGVGWAELTLVFLLSAALCLEATFKMKFGLSERLTWADARQDCQKEHTDIVSWPVMSEYDLGAMFPGTSLWVGLLRDQERDSVWRWINLETGDASSGEDVSRSSAWAEDNPFAHCVVVEVQWEIVRCTRKIPFYCSNGTQIEYYKEELTWYEASEFCQANNGFLVTVDSANAANFTSLGWIGLYRRGGDNWEWVGNVSSEYTNWPVGEPRKAFDCAVLETNTGLLVNKRCRSKNVALCFKDNLVMVNENKTWEDAVAHCREMEATCSSSTGDCQHNYDLLSLTDRSHYNFTRIKIAKATTNEVWTGLRFLGGSWWWLDGEHVDPRNLLPDCPSEGNRCGALSKSDSNFLITSNCSEKRNFICAKII